MINQEALLKIAIQMAPFFLIFIVFYFLIIGPQKKEALKKAEMLTQLKEGDMVITKAGLVGRIVRLEKKNHGLETLWITSGQGTVECVKESVTALLS